MSRIIEESDIEEVALEILKELGYKTLYGPDISPGGERQERGDYSEVVLVERLQNSISYINPKLPADIVKEVAKKIIRLEGHELLEINHLFHKYLTDGIDIEYRHADGKTSSEHINVFDFDNPEKNEFLAVNQFTVIENGHDRRPDILLFVNGLPLVTIELKNPADETATIWTAYDQVLGTYQKEIPTLFQYNEIIVISDGNEARAGTMNSGKEWFSEWKTIDYKEPKQKLTEIEILFRGMLNKNTLLDLAKNFIVFAHNKHSTQKILAAYHQYNAVNKSLIATVEAVKTKNRKCGIVWHSTGGGKSFVMVFYAGKLALSKYLNNPTIVVLTDRNDLDDQLFDTFSACEEVLRQTPKQAADRNNLREILNVVSGGVVFTTLQKFLPENDQKFPLLSKRENIIVIADEAHRSQYDFIGGFAKHLRDAIPNASFIGFTGTPIERSDRSTRGVFGEDIDVYDMTQAVEDHATVKIYYESRLAKVGLKPEEMPTIDSEFEEVTEKEEESSKERLKSKWAQLEKIVGSRERIKRLASDIVDHFEKRTAVLEGKGMIICMSRRICVDLHNEIVKLRPQWYDKNNEKGVLKVIMTGSATDPVEWQEHIRNKVKRKELGDIFKDPNSSFKLAIVRDMWLTGFDAPSLHTMYIDKPMRSHNLIQAISRVNRVFKDKPGGLIVDYIGIGMDLKSALAEYTNKDKEQIGIIQESAVKLMLEKYDIIRGIMHGFDYKKFLTGSPKDKLDLLPYAIEYIIKQEDGEKRFLKYVTELSRAFALSVPNPKALEIRDEVGIFQMIKSAMVKKLESTSFSREEGLDTAIKQIISKAIISDRVIDIFAAAGLKKPNISILSDEFLSEVKTMPQKNLAFETLRKILNDEINLRFRKNIVKSRSFMEMLEKTVKKYHNRSLETAQLIQELIEQAKEIRAVENREKTLGLSTDEIAFYDALANNKSAVDVLGDKKLMTITHELNSIIHENESIDWTIKESIKARLRVLVKRVLKKYGYPPDLQKEATELVLKQATVLAENQ